ncbi:MAG TPA: UDP-3-O-(3-hydroxymyristoyl)glucosamine N-acyltransferase [Blastocatellia bacterium]|nr:UDP-3-O-(3-hydroxymyristoyl)glucosamine N-acyltransferase [Blastocatellia bacterium]
MRLDEISSRLSCQLEGDGAIEIEGVATLENASRGHLSFLTNLKYYAEAKKTRASAIIAGFDCPTLSVPLLKHQNPYLAFAKAVEIFYLPPPKPAAIHPTAWISETARIGRGVSLGAYTYIGDRAIIGDFVRIGARCTISEDVKIGDHTIIHSGCSIRERVSIGAGCVLQDNAVVGSDGFGFAKKEDGSWYKIYQAGTVIIEDNVEIGACSTIDRATLGETRVKAGAKIDNLVQVGHGSVIGEDSLICAQVGLAGSTKVGKNVLLAGQVGSAGHLSIGDGVIATGQTGIPGDVEPGKIISGSPSVENRVWLKSTAIFARLPEIQKTIRRLEKRLESLEHSIQVISQSSLID